MRPRDVFLRSLAWAVELLLVAVGPCTLARAQAVGLHLGSIHERAGFNNVNPGAYVRDAEGWTVGVYRNSVRRVSLYGGRTWESPAWHGLSAAVTVGVVTGYTDTVTALLVPSVVFTAHRTALRVGIVPRPPTDGGSAALHLMIERLL
jgi:hypothetical protein